jgi:hypothetical protein
LAIRLSIFANGVDQETEPNAAIRQRWPHITDPTGPEY